MPGARVTDERAGVVGRHGHATGQGDVGLEALELLELALVETLLDVALGVLGGVAGSRDRELEGRRFALVEMANVLTPGWTTVGIVTMRFLLMLTGTGAVAASAGADTAITEQAGRPDERQARQGSTELGC